MYEKRKCLHILANVKCLLMQRLHNFMERFHVHIPHAQFSPTLSILFVRVRMLNKIFFKLMLFAFFRLLSKNNDLVRTVFREYFVCIFKIRNSYYRLILLDCCPHLRFYIHNVLVKNNMKRQRKKV